MGKCHEIARVKAAMEELNPVYCAMTGSGSAVFGLFEHDDADKLSACLRSVFPGCDTFAAPCWPTDLYAPLLNDNAATIVKKVEFISGLATFLLSIFNILYSKDHDQKQYYR